VTDRELLELAAKAAGIEGEYVVWRLMGMKEGIRKPSDKTSIPWNSLTNDGNALRLAVNLGLDVCIDKPPVAGEPYTQAIGFVGDGKEMENAVELHNSDPYAATRRAITRAAAQIGKEMK
jgi:hypothetical protein